ncbi:hypothetical protein L484_008442 [Morus notabilis]|uniref:Uncharacterized protein n=1 Tax=Morus notabilis TaxID=981085 RepID=W9S3B3_9ROSA|nr:hypothetical protein L484_008442 [Morus notabilis]
MICQRPCPAQPSFITPELAVESSLVIIFLLQRDLPPSSPLLPSSITPELAGITSKQSKIVISIENPPTTSSESPASKFMSVVNDDLLSEILVRIPTRQFSVAPSPRSSIIFHPEYFHTAVRRHHQ